MIEAVPKCTSWRGVHNFEARYDLGAPKTEGVELRGPRVVEILETLRSKTYIHDICTKCGNTVKRGA